MLFFRSPFLVFVFPEPLRTSTARYARSEWPNDEDFFYHFFLRLFRFCANIFTAAVGGPLSSRNRYDKNETIMNPAEMKQ